MLFIMKIYNHVGTYVYKCIFIFMYFICVCVCVLGGQGGGVCIINTSEYTLVSVVGCTLSFIIC